MRRLREACARIVTALAPLSRIAVALTLLVLVGVASFTGVRRVAERAVEVRIDDRTLVAAAMAPAASVRLAVIASEAEWLAARIGPAQGPRAQPALEAWLAGPPSAGRQAVLFDRSVRVTAATPDLAALVGQVRPGCDDVLAGLAGRRAVSAVFPLPGRCREPSIASSAPTASGGTAVVLVPVAEATTGLDELRPAAGEAGRVAEGLRVALVEVQHGDVLRHGAPPDDAPEGLRELAARLPSGPAAGTYTDGGRVVVAALASIGHGWAVLVEQDRTAFQAEASRSPVAVAGSVAAILVLTCAAMLALLAAFDVHRRRAQRRADAAKDAFLSIAGHELRTPLTVIKGFTETLASRWDDLDDRKRRTLVDKMLPQTRRLGRVLERILLAANIRSGAYARPRCVPTPLEPSLERVAQRFRTEAPLHTFDVPTDTTMDVMADPAALETVLEHLLDNALKYSPGGGTVRIRAQNRRRAVAISVSDDGVGLPSDPRRIFDLFSQGEAVDKRVHDEGGAGIGLFLVRTLVHDIGGTVTAERLARGTRFVVVLRSARTRTKTPATAAN